MSIHSSKCSDKIVSGFTLSDRLGVSIIDRLVLLMELRCRIAGDPVAGDPIPLAHNNIIKYI